MSDPLLAVTFALAAAVSLAASWQLVVSLERIGARIGASEALLGMLAALAADAPEISTAITALVRHDQGVGAGVVIGSNVFNLAALIGLSALVSGYIVLHRRAVALTGSVAVWIAAVTLGVVAHATSAALGLALVAAVLAPYVAALAAHHRLTELALPRGWARWLDAAITEEELELEVAIHPRRGGRRDAATTAAAIAAIVAASIVMEHTATRFGTRHDVPAIVIGAVVLAAVTSLPNAVAAIYLATRGRGAAVLSTALNSNAFNVLGGLLIPGAILGLGGSSARATFVASCYVAMTLLAVLMSYRQRGLRRGLGVLLVACYAAFVAILVAW